MSITVTAVDTSAPQPDPDALTGPDPIVVTLGGGRTGGAAERTIVEVANDAGADLLVTLALARSDLDADAPLTYGEPQTFTVAPGGASIFGPFFATPDAGAAAYGAVLTFAPSSGELDAGVRAYRLARIAAQGGPA
jgi:hypothetical protein